ncbi:MAG: TauD/TfdA family dioxygenase [Alphaproteobacteria bacterium]|nr:TauD/TfdA family dioxygenase [Alphaproteobacteria bacterium]
MTTSTRSQTITVRPVTTALGAEIEGVDLSGPLDAETVQALRQALLDHLVIFFRDQDLTADQYLAFAHAIGEPMEYPFVKGLPGASLITPVVKEADEETNFGGVWHSDTAYLDEPPMATMLLARETPPYGGDTMFANQQLAYERLSDGLRDILDGLTAINSSVRADGIRTRVDKDVPVLEDGNSSGYEAEHPVVRTHPESGRKSLYVNRGHTVNFVGMTEEESLPILNYLFEHQIRDEFTCRFRWRPGSLALWDNRSALHYPLNDYHGHRREMHRITLRGDKPR